MLPTVQKSYICNSAIGPVSSHWASSLFHHNVLEQCYTIPYKTVMVVLHSFFGRGWSDLAGKFRFAREANWRTLARCDMQLATITAVPGSNRGYWLPSRYLEAIAATGCLVATWKQSRLLAA